MVPLVDFAPLDSIFAGTLPAPQFPWPGDSRIPAGFVLNPGVAGFPTLSLDNVTPAGSPIANHVFFMRPIYKRADAQVIGASVPLSEMFGYSTTLRSMSQGRAVYSMQFSRYEEVPKTKADEIIAKVRG